MSTVGSSQTYPYKKFTKEDGLPSNYIYRTIQDEEGYLWIATLDGLVKYDGHSFQTFTTSDGLPINDVFEIIEDYQNRLWISSDANALTFIQNDSIFSRDKASIIRIRVHKVHPDFTALNSKPNYYRFGKDNLMETLPSEEEISKDLCFKNNSLLAKRNSIIRIFNGKMLSFNHRNKNEVQICFDKNGESITVKLNPENEIFAIRPMVHFDHTTEEIQIMNNRFLITLDSLNIIKRYEVFLPQRVDVNSLFLDRNGNIWASATDGLYLINDEVIRNEIFIFPQAYDDEVLYIEEYKGGLLYSELRGQIFYIKDGKKHLIFKLPEDFIEEALYSPQVVEDKLIFSARVSSIYFLDLENLSEVIQTGRTIEFQTFVDRSLAIIPKIVKVNDADISFSNSRGVYKYKFGDSTNTKVILGKLTSYDQHQDRFIATRPQGIEYKSAVFHDTLHTFLNNPIYVQFLNKDKFYVNTSTQDSYICDLDTCIQQYDLKKVLTKKLMFENDELWLVHKGGAILIDWLAEKEFKVLQDFPLTQITNCFVVHDLVVGEKKMTFATDKGIYTVERNNFSIENRHLNLIIQNVKTGKSNHVKPTSNIDVSYEERDFEFNFSTITYRPNLNIRYQYQLVGIDDDLQVTSARLVRYPDLDAGKYIFRIQASSELGETSDLKEIQISVRNPWWQTIYFFLAIALSCLALVYFFYKRREKQLQQRSEVSQKFAQLELNALQSQMNPHFVFNCMGSLQNLIQKGDIDVADRFIAKFATLMRSFLESSKHKFVSIADEIQIIELYFELEKLRFADKISMNIMYDLPQEARQQMLPANLLQPFVENAINHGLFHKKGHGRIEIRLYEEKDVIHIEIEDNGIGREASSVINSKNKKLHVSRAIEILNDKIAIISNMEGINIQYEMIDLYDNNQAAGTKVTIKIFPTE